MVDIYFAQTKDTSVIPSKNAEDAGFDIYPCFEEDYIKLLPHETRLVPTGIASAVDAGWYFQLFERGSTGIKGIGQRCGVIDSGYRGEWFVPITNHNNKPLVISKIQLAPTITADSILYPYNKAICQAVLLPVPETTITKLSYEDLMKIKSIRGVGKLSSTGK